MDATDRSIEVSSPKKMFFTILVRVLVEIVNEFFFFLKNKIIFPATFHNEASVCQHIIIYTSHSYVFIH